MKVVLTNLSNQLYKESRLLLNESAQQVGITEIKSFDFKDLPNTNFYLDNKEILDQSKGLGYWLWKPYIILEAMKSIRDNDIVVYSDCGIQIIADITPLLELCIEKSPIILFGNCNDINAAWVKRDCFILMDCDHEKFWYGPHCDAAFALFRKTDLSLTFLNDWLKYGSNKNIISDLPNECNQENLPEFIDHRWDQSILSLLAQKYKLELYRMPTQFGNHYKRDELRIENEFNCISQANQAKVKYYHVIPYYNSAYGQLLNHHRSKSIESDESSLYKQKNKVNILKTIVRKLLSKLTL